MSSLDCILAFGALEGAFIEAGWTKLQLGWFLLGAAVSTLKKCGVSFDMMIEVIKESYGDEIANNPSTVN